MKLRLGEEAVVEVLHGSMMAEVDHTCPEEGRGLCWAVDVLLVDHCDGLEEEDRCEVELRDCGCQSMGRALDPVDESLVSLLCHNKDAHG